jgi:DNA ligase-associated metallophosphoesterase
MRVEIRGESLDLLPERGIWWSAEKTLLIADAHLGKAECFQTLGVPLPLDASVGTLATLSHLLTRTRAERLIVLGDLLHARAGRTPALVQTVTDWRKQHQQLDWVLVRGNHDYQAGDPPAAWAVRCVHEPLHAEPFLLYHHPGHTAADRPAEWSADPLADDHYRLAGHVHPAVQLRGLARQRLRLPCFFFGRQAGLLPAFGQFTGTAIIRPGRGERVYVVADGQVFEVRHAPHR